MRMQKAARSRLTAAAPEACDTHLRMALEAAGMVTWEWDLEKDVIRYSRNVPDIAGGKKVQPYCSAASLLEAVHPEDRDFLARALSRTISEGILFDCEYRVRLLDGKYHWIHGRGKLTVKKRGKPALILGVSQDVTARKKMELELHARSRQLAELAEKLTMTEYIERRRLASLLHENLQQQLVAALMHIHALAAPARGRSKDEFLLLQQTLDEVLGLCRSISMDLAPPVLPQKDLTIVMEWIAHSMHEMYRLKVDVKTSPLFIQASESTAVLLYTAARELLMNVVRHARTRRAKLRLRLRPGNLELEVSDSGAGFTPKILKESVGRRGFGLFSIRERAELLGGRLNIESAPGRGTRVVLRLPCKKEAQASGASKMAKNGQKTVKNAQKMPKKCQKM